MSVRIVGEEPEAGACFYDSVTMQAFGPVFSNVDEADDFLEWVTTTRKVDLRELNPRDIENLVEWWKQETQ